MATLSGTKKKQKRNLIIMVVAIIVVLAALAFVLFDKLSAKVVFENEDFANAVAKAEGKFADRITASELSKIKYIGVSYDSTSETCNVTYGTEKLVDYLNNIETNPSAYADFDAAKESKNVSFTIAKPEEIKAEEEAANAAMAERDAAVEAANAIEDEDEKNAALDAANAIEIPEVESFVPVLDDLMLFKNAEFVELFGTTISDTAKFAEFKNITTGTFSNCGLTSVECFKGIANDNLKSLSIIFNDVDSIDWSPLDAVADKVIVQSGYGIEADENGNYQLVPQQTTLTDYRKQKEEAAAAEAEEEASEEEETEVESEEPVEEEAVEGEETEAEETEGEEAVEAEAEVTEEEPEEAVEEN